MTRSVSATNPSKLSLNWLHYALNCLASSMCRKYDAMPIDSTLLQACASLVSSPDPTLKEGKGTGDFELFSRFGCSGRAR